MKKAFSLALVSALFAAPLSFSHAADDGGSVRILVVKEHGVGSPTLAQPYLDRFVATAAKHNKWTDAKGQYYVTRAAAEDFIVTQKPHYGILSLAAFLDFRARFNLEVIGKVDVSLGGGQQYFLISTVSSDLVGCRGKKVASDHLTDPRFINTVVFHGDFELADFTLVPTQRPLQTIKELLSGKADCALIDDVQLADLAKLSGAAHVKTAWTSGKMPPMVVVAFPNALTAERREFQNNFGKVCDGDTKPACAEVGISALDMASAADYAAVVAAYGN